MKIKKLLKLNYGVIDKNLLINIEKNKQTNIYLNLISYVPENRNVFLQNKNKKTE